MSLIWIKIASFFNHLKPILDTVVKSKCLFNNTL